MRLYFYYSFVFCGFRSPSAERGHSCLNNLNADLDLTDEFDLDLNKKQILGLSLATFQGTSINFDGVSMQYDDH